MQFIFFAALIDVFDGKIARRLNISSEFGKEIDSLADLVSFCIVPSLLLFIHYIKVIPHWLSVLLINGMHFQRPLQALYHHPSHGQLI